MKRAAAVFGLAVAGSQAGHLLAYELRFGAAAQQLQSTGVHAYFPLLAKTLIGGAALVVIGSLLLVGFARVATGRKLDKASAPSLLRLLALLYTLQLALFVAQEAIEGSPAGDMFLWGLVGQLPVALAGAVALRWLLGRLAPAIARIARRCELVWVFRIPAPPVSLVLPAVAVAPTPAAVPITRRGPPPSF